ncbi:MAG: hypothetical protein Q9164_007241, partial [Protoblastenia rupestris]
MGNIEDESGSNDAKGSQAEDGSQEMEHNGNGAGDRPGNEDEVEYGGDDVIVDPVMDGIGMDNGDGPQIKDGHSLGVGGNGEGVQNLSDAKAVHSSHCGPRRGRGRPRRSRPAIT